MIGSTIFDTAEFSSRLDEAYKDDKKYKEDCGWDEHDLNMIAEGMLQAEQVLRQMQLEAQQENKEYKECKSCEHLVISTEQKFGEWIPKDVRSRELYARNYTCSICGADPIGISNYCPYCGAKMTVKTK